MVRLEALAPADAEIIQDKTAAIIMKRFDSQTSPAHVLQPPRSNNSGGPQMTILRH
jgi:hypothetical protein